MSSPLESTEKNLRDAIQGQELDVQDLEQLDMMLALDPELAKSAQSLLPLITELAQTNSEAIDSFPSNLIPKILSGASLSFIFQLIPPPLFSAGLDQPNTAPLLVQMLQRVQKSDKEGIELCCKVMNQLLDPEVTYIGQIEKLVAHLVTIDSLPPIPDQELYESTDPQLQSRLMAINTILLKHKNQPRFLFWDLTSPDIRDDPLLLDIHIIYIGDLCALGVDISQQMPLICSMYVQDEPFVCFHIERIFLELYKTGPVTFKQYDNQCGLVAKGSPSLLARLPPQYLAEHKEVVESLSLSARTLPAFCNLATDPITFEILNLSPRVIANLPFDLRAQFVAAATLNKDTARLFVGRYPTIMDEIVVPAANPEAAQYQKEIEQNLKRSGLRVAPPPEVATAHAGA